MPFVDDQGNPVPVQPLAAAPVPLTAEQKAAASYAPPPAPAPPGIDFSAVTAPVTDGGPPVSVPVAPGAPAIPSQAIPPGPESQGGAVIPIRRPTPGAAPAAPAPGGGGIPGELDALGNTLTADTAAEQKATENAGDVEAYGKAQTARATEDQARLQSNQAIELAAHQQYVRDRQDALNQQDRQNLEYANQKVIPDFWSGREGAHVGASIGVVLAGIGAGFLGSTQNQAEQVIQHNVDKYYDRKKEEIDNLFKYAQSQGLVNDKARDQYAKSITDLLQQHAATLDAAKTRVEAVAQESQSDDAKARAAVLAAQLKAASDKGMLAVTDARIKLYDADQTNQTKLISAKADMIRARDDAARVGIERQKAAATGGDEKADEAAFRTYVQAPHGKEAQTLNLRLSNIDSGIEDIKRGKSEGEVTKALEAIISADTGQGTRGVSQGQLHTIIPNLVSAEGKVSNAVSQNWNGKAGKEYREAVTRLAQSVKDNREREYATNRANLEKNLALTPHGQKNAAFAKTSAAQLYPERAATVPAADAGTKTLKMPDGSLATFDASGKRIK